MQFAAFLSFTALVAVISYFSTKKTREDTADGYFLGGRSLTGVVIAGSLLLTNLSTEQIVGLNGAAFREGILVTAWETLAAAERGVVGGFAIGIEPTVVAGEDDEGVLVDAEFLECGKDLPGRVVD